MRGIFSYCTICHETISAQPQTQIKQKSHFEKNKI